MADQRLIDAIAEALSDPTIVFVESVEHADDFYRRQAERVAAALVDVVTWTADLEQIKGHVGFTDRDGRHAVFNVEGNWAGQAKGKEPWPVYRLRP